MSRGSVLCCVLVVSLATAALAGRFGGRISKPSRGGGSHHYPPSRSGLSGQGQDHAYPKQHNGYSGDQSHSYPKSQSGLSGDGNSRSHYPQSQSPSYPKSQSGLSGDGDTHNVPQNNFGSQGGFGSPGYKPTYNHPSQSQPMNYPVYRGNQFSPPPYEQSYQNSGSKYAGLLTGLAMLNLGLTASTLYTASRRGGDGNSQKSEPGEVCKLQIIDGKNFEETTIPCHIISAIIKDENNDTLQAAISRATNATHATSPVVQNTTITTQNVEPNATDTRSTLDNPLRNINLTEISQNVTMSENTTLNNPILNDTLHVSTHNPVENSSLNSEVMKITNDSVNLDIGKKNETDSDSDSESDIPSTTKLPQHDLNNTKPSTSQDSAAAESKQVSASQPNALDVKGPPIQVTSGMTCMVLRSSPTSKSRKEIPCKLLEEYSKQQSRRNLPVSSLSCRQATFSFASALVIGSMFMRAALT